jgi:hypothetical protein
MHGRMAARMAAHVVHALGGSCMRPACASLSQACAPAQHPPSPNHPPNQPTGKISEEQVTTQFYALLFAGLATAGLLDVWAGHDKPILFGLAVFGSFISYIYSAPPLKLKQSGWAGNYALGSSYIALPWWAGQVSRYPLYPHTRRSWRSLSTPLPRLARPASWQLTPVSDQHPPPSTPPTRTHRPSSAPSPPT